MKKIISFSVLWIWSAVYSTDLPDVNAIYKLHDVYENGEHFLVDVELHSMTNSLGKLFHLPNETIISQTSSSLPAFSCFPSQLPCDWKSYDTWTTSFIDEQQLNALSLPTQDFKLSCKYNNGSCQFSCRDSSQGPICSCPIGFSLNADGRTCSGASKCHYLLTDDHRSFNTPNYPSSYELSLECKWLIVTSKEKIIHLEIPKLRTESTYDYVILYDGLSDGPQGRLGSFSGQVYGISLRSTGNIMLVHFHSDHSNTFSGFQATYTTETKPTVDSHLNYSKLMNEKGVIRTTLNISRVKLCVSIIHTLSNSGSINVTAEKVTGDNVYFRLTHTTQVNEWYISRFSAENEIGISQNLINLYVYVNGQNSKILSITECSSDGQDIYRLGNLRWSKSVLQKFAELHSGFNIYSPANLDSNKCQHGGLHNIIESKCVCPPGFTGSTCQEACGSNRYGQSCIGECSWFETGCKNMIFCNSMMNCTCASGFKGMDCGTECEPGTYGANCWNTCGLCENGPCNIFTGECNSLCTDGYYPPFCQQPYVFLKSAPTVMEKKWNNAVISINFTNTKGLGSPYLYEIQYKEKGKSDWIRTPMQEISDTSSLVTANVTGLEVGTTYLLRVIIISDDGNSYDGSQIPTVQFETICDVPDSSIYQLNSRNITSSSFIITWKYPILNNKWCPVSKYQVTLHERWRTYTKEVPAEENQTLQSNLLPGYQYAVHLCAMTRKGKVPCSLPLTVTTMEKAPGRVRQLRVESRNANTMHISWRRPLFTGGIVKEYRINYECVRYLICEETCINSSGHLTTTGDSVTLINLLPHAQYKVRVAAFSAVEGPPASILATTKTTTPSASPIASAQSIVSKSNTTVTVQWLPPHCPELNGHLTGYFYSLFSDTESGKKLFQSGITKLLNTTFMGLSPMTEYYVHVRAMNSHGWNTDYYLIIPFSSSATVPEIVQDLKVYKKGRRMLGIRWRKPSRTYGTLKSFTIAFHQKEKEHKLVETVSPTFCSGWPDLFCHTINYNFLPDKQYVVTVTARNSEIEQEGAISEVITTTRENAPDAPTSLSLLRSTNSSLELQWRLPNMFNGELRSFLVNIEHTESLDDSECCEYYPVQELPFREESPFYNLEVNALVPASTYVVSVSAKTITLGPSINSTYYTAPSPPTDLKPPQILGLGNGSSYIVKIQPSRSLLTPNSVYLLLVLPPGSSSTSIIWKPELMEKLTRTVNQSFYIVSEFTNDRFTDEIETKISTGAEPRNGKVGILKDPALTPGHYKFALAIIQTYHDAISVGVTTSNNFEIDRLLELE